MKRLHIIASVDPRGGGPIASLLRQQKVLAGLGHSATVMSLDAPDDQWARDFPLPLHALGPRLEAEWTQARLLARYRFSRQAVPWLRENLDRFDAVVVHGLWNFSALAARLALAGRDIPYVVFPHGMLDPWFARRGAKHALKQAHWLVAEAPLLQRACAVLFTSQAERESAERAFWPYRLNGRVVRYGAEVPAEAGERKGWNRSYLLFLGRLHPKKGCDLLLEAFADVASNHPELDLVIAGPDQAGYGDVLAAMARRLGIAARVRFAGMITGEEKWRALRGAEALVLPSHGENFGVVVAEALGCGTPVLLSDKVNICGPVMAGGAGLVAADNVAGVTAQLQHFLSLDPGERQKMRAAALEVYRQHFRIEDAAADLAGVLEEAVAAKRLAGA